MAPEITLPPQWGISGSQAQTQDKCRRCGQGHQLQAECGQAGVRSPAGQSRSHRESQSPAQAPGTKGLCGVARWPGILESPPPSRQGSA